MENLNASKYTSVSSEPSQAVIGRFNRLVLVATKALVALGHVKKRFKRNYATGVATYHCPKCNSVATVKLNDQTSEPSELTAVSNNCI